MTPERAKRRAGHFLLVGSVRLQVYLYERKFLLLMSDLVALLGPRVKNWRQRFPALMGRQYSVVLSLDDGPRHQRVLLSLEGARLLCTRYMRRDIPVFELLRTEIDRVIGPPPTPQSLPARTVTVLQPLPLPLICMGFVLHRYECLGQVVLLASEVGQLPGVSPWALLQRNPGLKNGGGVIKKRVAGSMQPRTLFTFATVREMALVCHGPGAQALFDVVTTEIEAGRHLHPGSAQ